MSALKNISTRRAIDLADGRVIAPLETVDNVEITDHERLLIDQGDALLLDSKGRDQSSRVKAPKTDEEAH